MLTDAGPDLNGSLYADDYQEESDLGQFSLMGNVEKEFSMPQQMTVCHDSDRIHGLRLMLKMHRYKYRNEAELIKEYDIQDAYDQIDKLIADSKPRRMTLVGSGTGKCEIVEVFRYGHMRNIEVFFDDSGVRALKMQLTNGKKLSFGAEIQSKKFESDLFEFQKGQQLLGIHGKVGYGASQPERLLTLGFFKDECSDTSQLYMTTLEQQNMMAIKGGSIAKSSNFTKINFFISMIALFVTSCIVMYCCLKNRRSICKRQQGSRRQA